MELIRLVAHIELLIFFVESITVLWKENKNKPSALPESLRSIKSQLKLPMVNSFIYFRGPRETHQENLSRLKDHRFVHF